MNANLHDMSSINVGAAGISCGRRAGVMEDKQSEQSIMLENGRHQDNPDMKYANWSLGLCGGCLRPGLCCWTFWCAPCRKARTADRANVMTCWKFLFLYLLLLATFVAMTIASTVYGVEHDGTEPLWLFVLVALGWCAWIAMYVVDVWVRGRIRARFRIAGDWCTDCALVTRCCFCTTCQEAHHVDRATRAGATYASDFI